MKLKTQTFNIKFCILPFLIEKLTKNCSCRTILLAVFIGWIILKLCLKLKFWFSHTDQQIGTLLYRDIQYAFFDFVESMLVDCDLNPSIGKIPLRWNTPVYGDKIPNFTDFAAPGVILTIIFFLSVALTSGAMLIERNEGMLERCLVSGITGMEILFSHVVTQFLIMTGQSILVLLFSFYVFELTLNGSIVWVVILTILTGLCGMCFGKYIIFTNCTISYKLYE